MKVPSEELVEAIRSELQAHAEQTHKDTEGGECEFCLFCKELDRRDEKLDGEKLCALDMIPHDLIMGDAMGPLLMMIGGRALAQSTILIARVCFLMGMKAQKALTETDQLNSMSEL